MVMYWYSVSSVLLLLVACSNSQTGEVYPPLIKNGTEGIVFGLFLSSEGRSSTEESGVRRAVEDINNSSLLRGCTLQYITLETQCNRSLALKKLFELGTSAQKSVAIIDAGCSLATEATAEISHLFGYSQISCRSSSPVLMNKERFPQYFQLLPSRIEMATLYAAIVNEFNWTHVVFIVQENAPYSTIFNKATEVLTQKNVTYMKYSIESNIGISGLDPLLYKKREERIFIIIAMEEITTELLCMASRTMALNKSATVFITEYYSQDWYQKINSSDCQLETVLNHLSVTHFEQYKMGSYDPYCYDATHFFTTALHHTLNKTAGSHHCGLVKNATLLTDISRHLHNLSQVTMKGKTGKLVFDQYGVRNVEQLPVYQYRYTTHGAVQNGPQLIKFGTLVKNETETYILLYNNNESNQTVFPDGIPYDGKPIIEVTTLFLPVTVIFGLVTSSGIVFALGCLIFTFKFRNHKVVRLTSPKLNYFIIVGAVLFYIDVYFFTLPTYTEAAVRLTCNAETWFTVLGYTFCFGTIMAKMARVWIIFRNPKPKMRRVISDWVLIVAVGILLAVDLIILTVFTIIEQAGIGGELIRLTENLELPQSEGEVQYLRYYCDSKPHDIVSGFFYGYKGLLQVVALVLAFMTRKVKVKGLDDAKFIAAIIYITSIIISVLTVVEYTLDDYINAYASIFATGLILAPTCVLLLVFIPTMVRLYKDPKGEKVFTAPTSIPTFGGDDQTILTLKTRVKELEDLLSTTMDKTKVTAMNCDVLQQ